MATKIVSWRADTLDGTLIAEAPSHSQVAKMLGDKLRAGIRYEGGMKLYCLDENGVAHTPTGTCCFHCVTMKTNAPISHIRTSCRGVDCSMYSFTESGGNGILVPSYITLKAKTLFTANPTNPLDDNLPHTYNRIVGIQTLVVKNLSTNFVWTANFQGGANLLNNGYLGSFDASTNYGVFGFYNCTVTPIPPPIPASLRVSNFRVNTFAPDNRTYLLSYSPFTSVLPTITLDPASPPLGVDSLEVLTVFARNGAR